MDPEIPRSGDNGLGTGSLILRQLGQNSETPFPYRPLVSVMLVKLLTIWHGRNNPATNPVLSEQRPVFKEIRCQKIRVCRWICPVFKENSQVSYDHLGDEDQAITSFTTAINLDPSYENAYYNRAEIYIKTSQYSLAIADMIAAIQLKPNDWAAYNDLGVVAQRLGYQDIATALFAVAQSKSSNSGLPAANLLLQALNGRVPAGGVGGR